MSLNKIADFDTPLPRSSDTVVEEGKTIAMIAYLTVVGHIIALVMNNDKKNRFAVGLVSWVPFLGWILGLVAFFVLVYMWVAGLMNAINGKEKVVPILGDKYLEWFKGI